MAARGGLGNPCSGLRDPAFVLRPRQETAASPVVQGSVVGTILIDDDRTASNRKGGAFEAE
jgi:hypothetical protein